MKGDINETRAVDNVSSSTIVVHFITTPNSSGPQSSGDTVDLGKSNRGLFNDSYQTDGVLALSETATAAGANHGEAELAGHGGAVLNLDDTHTVAGPGNVTWALQWDLTIAGGDHAIISKDKHLQLASVPEPSVMALCGRGLAGFLLRRNKRA